MKITMVMVSSADGRITRGGTSGTSEWASAEDQKSYRELIKGADCLIMGANTYRAARPHMKPDANRLRVIVTRDPEQFEEDAALSGLHFTAENPEAVVAGIKAEGHENVLLVGGSAINALFLDAGLVDDIFLSLEPKLFGDGLPLTGPLLDSIELQLVDYKKLNERGTLLLHYEVRR
nr:RibD C-terminal domain protein [uncultured bacterium]